MHIEIVKRNPDVEQMKRESESRVRDAARQMSDLAEEIRDLAEYMYRKKARRGKDDRELRFVIGKD